MLQVEKNDTGRYVPNQETIDKVMRWTKDYKWVEKSKGKQMELLDEIARDCGYTNVRSRSFAFMVAEHIDKYFSPALMDESFPMPEK